MNAADLYSKLYNQAYGDGPISRGRSDLFAQVVEEFVPVGSSILEVGTGRAYLMRKLIAAGYHCAGIEIATSLFEHDLADLNVLNLPAEELHVFADESFDAVISNDVLEHLADEATMTRAVTDMLRISKRWVIASVGVFASSFPYAEKELSVPLHTVLHDSPWWESFFGERVAIRRKVMVAGSFLVAGEKGGQGKETKMAWRF
jgi:ubiquinone/menaquinone biosynthesis C-methylase UbiE